MIKILEICSRRLGFGIFNLVILWLNSFFVDMIIMYRQIFEN